MVLLFQTLHIDTYRCIAIPGFSIALSQILGCVVKAERNMVKRGGVRVPDTGRRLKALWHISEGSLAYNSMQGLENI